MMFSIQEIVDKFSTEKVYQEAKKILREIGLKVENEKILKELKKTFKVDKNYVKFEDKLIEEVKEEIRKKGKIEEIKEKKLTTCNSRWCHHYIEPNTLKILPFDIQNVIKYTKLIAVLIEEEKMSGQVVGYPLDIHPNLQFLTAYYIDCCYNPKSFFLGIAENSQIMKFKIEIANVMGHEIGIGCEPVSPLTFAGNSIDVAYDYLSYQPGIGIDPMPILGINAPLNWEAGWAQSIAENLGSYAILKTLGFKKIVPPSFRLFLPNFISGSIYFSSPHHIYALLLRRKVREYFGLSTNKGELILVTSKMPDSQAATEKTMGAVLAYIYGFYHLEGAGALYLDEIFSPQQLIIDLEIINLVNSIRLDLENIDDILSLIKEGLDKPFLMQEKTLSKFNEFTWRPFLFNLTPRAKFELEKEDILKKANYIAEEKIKKYNWELDKEKKKELDKIISKAKETLR